MRYRPARTIVALGRRSQGGTRSNDVGPFRHTKRIWKRGDSVLPRRGRAVEIRAQISTCEHRVHRAPRFRHSNNQQGVAVRGVAVARLEHVVEHAYELRTRPMALRLGKQESAPVAPLSQVRLVGHYRQARLVIEGGLG